MKRKFLTRFLICLIFMLLFPGFFVMDASAAAQNYVLLYTGEGEHDSAELSELLSTGKAKNITDHQKWNVLPAKWKKGIFMVDLISFYQEGKKLDSPQAEHALEVYSINEKSTNFALLNPFTEEYMVFKNASEKVNVYRADGKKKNSGIMGQAAEITYDKDGKPKTIYLPAAALEYLYGYRCVGRANLGKQGYKTNGITVDGHMGNYSLICLDPLQSGKLKTAKAAKLVDSIVREYRSPDMYRPVEAQEQAGQDFIMVYTGGVRDGDVFGYMAYPMGSSYSVRKKIEDNYHIYYNDKDITDDITQARENSNPHISFFSAKEEKGTVMIDLSEHAYYIEKFQDLSFFPNTDWAALKREDFGIAYIDKNGDGLAVFNSFAREYGVFKNGSKNMVVYSFEGKKKGSYTLARPAKISMRESGEYWTVQEAWVSLEAFQYLFGYYYTDAKELKEQGYPDQRLEVQSIADRAGKKAYVEKCCWHDCSVLILDPTKQGKMESGDVAGALALTTREYEDSYYYLLGKEIEEAIQSGSMEKVTATLVELENSRHLYSQNEEDGTYIMEPHLRVAVEWMKTTISGMPYGEFTEKFLALEQTGGLDWLRDEKLRDEIVAVAVERLLREDDSRFGMWKLTYREFIEMYRSIGTENDLFLKALKEKGTAHTEELKYYEYDLVPGIEFAFEDVLSEKIYCLEYAPFNYNYEDLESGDTGKGRFEAFYDHGGVCSILAWTYEYFIRDILGEDGWQYAFYSNDEVGHEVLIVKTEDGKCFQADNAELDYWWLGSLITPDDAKLGSVWEDAEWREAFEQWKVDFVQLSEVRWHSFTVSAHSSDEKNEWATRPVWYDYGKNEWQMYLGEEFPRYLKYTYTGLPGKIISMAGYTKLSGYIDLDELEFH